MLRGTGGATEFTQIRATWADVVFETRTGGLDGAGKLENGRNPRVRVEPQKEKLKSNQKGKD